MKPDVVILSVNGAHKPERIGNHAGFDLLELRGRAAGSPSNPILLTTRIGGFSVLVGDPANPEYPPGDQHVADFLPFVLLSLASPAAADITSASGATTQVSPKGLPADRLPPTFVLLRVSVAVDPSGPVTPDNAVMVRVWVARGKEEAEPLHGKKTKDRPVFVVFPDTRAWISESQKTRGLEVQFLSEHEAGAHRFIRSAVSQEEFEAAVPF